ICPYVDGFDVSWCSFRHCQNGNALVMKIRSPTDRHSAVEAKLRYWAALNVRRHMRTLIRCAGSVALLVLSAGPLSAEDGAPLYKQICAACHDTGIDRAPNREALRTMTPERVLAALETGAMISMTSGRTAVERRAIAEFVTGKPFGRPLVTTPSPQSLCPAAAGVRAAVTIGRVETDAGSRDVAFIGDRAGDVYAVEAAKGTLLWKTKVDDHPVARVTGSPVFHNGRLYVPVASGEETAGATSGYECCRFRGSLVALDGATGRQIWKTYTIAEEARPTTKNKAGTQM